MYDYRFAMPEPPRWLIQKGRLKEAAAVIRRMCKVNKKKVPDDLDQIIEEIRVKLYCNYIDSIQLLLSPPLILLS